ncbi:MAG: acid phosphatase [Hyphomicrobiales bacterium]|nr:acid phosphatase [Hyphomicrobiales bacterium]MDE2373605.1 acid phosphatase [Hyphomicrobiales bacterium]
MTTLRTVCLGTAVAVAVVASVASWPVRAEDASGCRNPPARQELDTKWPINIGLLARQLIAYRCTDYMNDVAAAVAQARDWVRQRAPQVDNAAVVLDIDETSLSNWEVLYHDHFAFFADGPCDLGAKTACGWRNWFLSARGVALSPTLDFVRLVKTLNDRSGGKVAVFFITGRRDEPQMRAATEQNLRMQGYEDWEGLYLRPPASPGFVSVYKTDIRKQIEQKYHIVANLGDQYSDLIGDPGNDHAEKCFKLPNPFYFLPPDLPPAGIKCLSH